MYSVIKDAVIQLLPPKRKSTNTWISFNAVCCQHNGESADRRGRGGVRPNADGSVSYHCFNCGFKTGYQPGRPLGYRFKKLLDWLGADENTIQRLSFEAMRVKELVAPASAPERVREQIEFKPRPLPDNSATVMQWASMIAEAGDNYVIPSQVNHAVEYLHQRKIDVNERDFYITEETAYNLHKRIIIPFHWKNQIIGYTARAFDNTVRPKYHNSHDANFVFNTDRQKNRAFVIVVEGPIDALQIDGVAVLGNECSDQQADIINSLHDNIIVVPDFDVHINEKTKKKVWPGRELIDTALDNGWSVSFPVWHEQYKDVADAIEHLGKLFVLKSILDAQETSALKIELLTKKIYNKL
jgi:hypothetical protein